MDWPYIGWTYTYGPAGGINSNVKDVSKWLRMQAQNGVFKENSIIKEESVKFMHAPKTPAGGTAVTPGPEQYYCLGWIHREAKPYPITWHNGGTSGSKTMIAFVPEAKLGIVVLSNLIDTTLPESLAWRFFDMYFGNPKHDWSKEALSEMKKAAEKAKAEAPKQPTVPSQAMALDRYAGDYSSEIYGAVNVAKKPDGLVLAIGPKKVAIDLRHWDGNTFMGSWDYFTVKEDAGPVTFNIDDKGAVTGMVMDAFNEDGCGVFRKITSAVLEKTAGRDKVVIDGMTVTREKALSCEFDKICSEAVTVNGVKQITYEQFQKLRKSGEKFVLADVLSSDDYNTGHIPGAISFPVKNINLYNAVNKIPMGSNVVVYCLDNHCPYSNEAAQKLTSCGYKVLAYKGGLDEWQQKGNALQK
jgi:rhodanese-related sulfurtransferase